MDLQKGGRHTREWAVKGLKVWPWWLSLFLILSLDSSAQANPTPKPWPQQFHAQLSQLQNTTSKRAVIDLWYDWPGGRNLNLIQHQLGNLIHDVEWTNGTSYYYDLEHQTCFTIIFQVGILRPDWLVDATYLGVREIDGFQCNVWEKVDFITYYEDIETQRPVYWLFYTGQGVHVITFEEGAVLEDEKWQAPPSCFDQATTLSGSSSLPQSGSSKQVFGKEGILRRWVGAFTSISRGSLMAVMDSSVTGKSDNSERLKRNSFNRHFE